MTTAKAYLDTHYDRLDFYTHAITNAHGQNHPEVFAVRDQYIKLRTDAKTHQRLDANFDELRRTTHNYAIPNDVCLVFKATYQMLAQADRLNASA